MEWASTNDVKLLTGLTDNDIDIDDLKSLIGIAQKEVLMQINNKVIRELVQYIDETRQNEIDGTNKTYYIKNWKGNFISDFNYDFSVNASDVTMYSVDGNGNELEVSIDSVTYDEGKIVVTTEQNNVDLYITYVYTYFDPVNPDPLLKLATEYLAGAYTYMRINSSQKKQVKFGNVTITNGIGKESAYNFLFDKYMDIIRQLNENTGRGAIWGVSKVLI
jgi:hypothetical protein